MAYEIPVLTIGLEAGGDLTAGQYKFVEIATTGKVSICNAATDKPIGVLQNKPNTGETAEVMVIGVTKVQGDADLAIGDLIGTSADGQADAKTPGTDTTEYVVGMVIQDNAAAGGYATAAINCATPHRAS